MSRAPAELDHEKATRNRLLSAAGEVFAEHGFKNATIREICKKAGANVAAINYHFGDKKKLYAEVLRFAHACASEKHPADEGLPANAAPEQRLRAFIVSSIRRVFDEGRPAWHGKLTAQEIIEPTAALNYLVQHEIRPRQQQLFAIIQDILGGKAGEATLRHASQSIIGQCIFYHHARPMIERIFPQQSFDAKGVEERAEMIYQFSLAALRGMKSKQKVNHEGTKGTKERQIKISHR